MRLLCKFGVLAGCLWLASAHALDGDADPNFGTNGQVAIKRVMVAGGNGTKPTGDLLMLPGGSYYWAAPLDDGSTWVGRAFRNGAPDTSFGTEGNGRVRLLSCGTSREVRLAPDAGDGVVVWAAACLKHLLTDGSVDAAFGGGALPPDGFLAADLERDAVGRYVLAGDAAPQLRVYRFDVNGVADTTFGTLGSTQIVVPTTNGTQHLNALAVRADGRILVGGSRGNTHGPNLIVAQLTDGGVLDTSWNGTGIVDIEAPPGYQTMIANALALDNDGSVVVSGVGSNGSTSCCILLTRLDAMGQIVPAFGLRIFQLSGQPSIFPFFEQRDQVVLLPNRRIVLGTNTFPFGAPFTHRTQFTLVRTFSDGELDMSFGHNGWNSYTIADPDDVGQAGDYVQGHAIGCDAVDDSMLMLGRTFFEDNSTGDDYTTLVRARFDLIFSDGSDR